MNQPNNDAYLAYVEARQKRQKLTFIRYVILFVLSFALFLAMFSSAS